MPAISAAELTAVQFAEQGSAPATPTTGKRKLYAKADGFYDIDDTGAEIGPLGAGIDSLADIGDVSVTTPSDGNLLTWDTLTSAWVAAAPVAPAAPAWDDVTDKPTVFPPDTHNHDLSGLGDVTAATPSDGDVLAWDTLTSAWIAAAPATPAAPAWGDVTDKPTVFPPDTHSHDYDLGDLGDVSAAAPTDGDVLTFDTDTSAWVAAAPAAVPSTLDSLTDVSAATPSNGDILTWDSTPGEWVPAAPAAGGDVATDAIFDAKGDLAVGTGANTASKLAVGANGKVLMADDGETTGLKWATVSTTQYKEINFSVVGALAVYDLPIVALVPVAGTITNVAIVVGTAPTGADVIVDIHQNGTTIFTTQGNRPTVAASGTEDFSSVPDVTSLAQNDKLTCHIDQVGSTVAGADMTVQIRYTVP